MEALVVSRRQTEDTEQRTVAASRVLEATMNQRGEIIARQLVRLERLMHNGPETFPGNQTLPETIRGARAALGSPWTCGNVLVRNSGSWH